MNTKKITIIFLGSVICFGCVKNTPGSDTPKAAHPVKERVPAKEVVPANRDHARWPIFRGNAALSGYTTETLSDSLELHWTYKTGGPIKSSPVIAGGKVFIGSDDGNVYALDVQSGTKIWSFNTEADVVAPPLIKSGTVYIGSSNGILYALEAKSGNLRWTYKTDGIISGSANWTAAADGKGIWILLGSHDNKIHCVNAENGKEVWTYNTDDFIFGTPAISAGQIVFGGCDSKIHVISVQDGKPIAVIEVDSQIGSSAAVAGQLIYVGNYGNQFICADIKSQNILWDYEDRRFSYMSSPAIGPTQVVFGGRDKRLHSVNREYGTPLWTFATRGRIDSSPVISGDRVVVGSSDGRLYLVSLAEGKELWSYEIGGPITGSPAVAYGMVVIGAEDGNVYAFRKKEKNSKKE